MSESYISDLNKYLDRQDKNSNDLEFFTDDIEDHLNIIEEQLMRMCDIADGYDIELSDVIKSHVEEILAERFKENN